MPRSSAERRAPAPQEDDKALRKNVDARTNLFGIRQTRGEGAGTERVSIVDKDGKERFVSMSREDLKKAEERADREFDRAINAVTAGEKLDAAAVAELMGSNKEQILALARKEGDVQGAVYKVMEDAVQAFKEYDKLVDKAVRESGYTGLVADSLRTSLQAERGRVFTEAFSSSAGPRAKRNLENAVRGKILAEASHKIAALAETVGSIALEDRPLTEQQVELAKVYAKALDTTDAAHKKMVAATRRLEKLRKQGGDEDELEGAVQEDDQYNGAWKAAINNVKRVAKKLEAAGIPSNSPEFSTKAARADLTRNLPEYVGGLRVAKPDTIEIIDEDEEQELEPDVIDLVGDIRSEISKLEGMESGKEANELDSKILKQTAEWAKEFIASNPDASAEDVMDKATAEGLDGYITGRDVARLMNGMSVERLHKADGKTDAGQRNYRDALSRMKRASDLNNSPDLPASVPAGEWSDESTTDVDLNGPLASSNVETVVDENGRLAKSREVTRPSSTLVPLRESPRAPAAFGSDAWLREGLAEQDETPDVTDDLVDDEPQQPGFLQRLGSSGLGKWMKRGMLMLGLGAAAKGGVDLAKYQPSSQRGEETHQVASFDTVAENQRTMADPMPEANVTTPSVEDIEAEEYLPTKTEVAAKRQVRKPGDVRNLEDALKIFASMPGKKEYQQMKAEERAAQLRASIEDIRAIHDALSGPSKAVEASKRIDLERKMEQERAFLDLMKAVHEIK